MNNIDSIIDNLLENVSKTPKEEKNGGLSLIIDKVFKSIINGTKLELPKIQIVEQNETTIICKKLMKKRIYNKCRNRVNYDIEDKIVDIYIGYIIKRGRQNSMRKLVDSLNEKIIFRLKKDEILVNILKKYVDNKNEYINVNRNGNYSIEQEFTLFVKLFNENNDDNNLMKSVDYRYIEFVNALFEQVLARMQDIFYHTKMKKEKMMDEIDAQHMIRVAILIAYLSKWLMLINNKNLIDLSYDEKRRMRKSITYLIFSKALLCVQVMNEERLEEKEETLVNMAQEFCKYIGYYTNIKIECLCEYVQFENDNYNFVMDEYSNRLLLEKIIKCH